jgi:hypothetical protein
MAWECAECHARESRGNRIDAVCHHCGKLLCRDDRVLIADLAFAGSRGGTDQVAVHCRPCKEQYHKVDVPLSRRTRS